jgi:uncharacterized protein (DUF302 family)
MTSAYDERGITSIASLFSVEETSARIQSFLEAKAITVFAVIDQRQEAKKVGLQLRPTQLIIFGDPKTGTPLMNAAPSLAIDLPLKALIWEDADGMVRISYNSPTYLQQRHGLAQTPFEGVGSLLSKALE